jgi:hypothetical protein
MSAKLVVLLSLGAVALFNGVARQLLTPGQLFSDADIPFMFLSIALIFFWFRLDANQRGYRRSPLLNVSVVALAIVALPYYFFRSRGFMRGALATGAFVLVLVGCTALQVCGEYAAYYARAI